MRYFVKRLAWIIPMIIILSIVISFISAILPDQQINRINEHSRGPGLANENDYYNTARKLGLNKPLFYLSIVPLHYPDTLFHLPYSSRYNQIKYLYYHGINWENIQKFRKEVEALSALCMQWSSQSNSPLSNQVLQRLNQLNNYGSVDEIKMALNYLKKIRDNDYSFPAINKLENSWNDCINQRQAFALFIPTIKWHGCDNQYSVWIRSIIKMKFGNSVIDDRPVSLKIGNALKWTLSLSIIALIMIFLLAIPFGLLMARKKNSHLDKWISSIVFIMYSVPTFWLATLLIVFFTNTKYCQFCDIFPSIGIINLSANQSFISSFFQDFSYFILPILCLLPGGIAYIYRQMRSNTLNEQSKTYVLSARARGIEEKTILWKYIFPNAVFPLITLISSILPGIITGSLIIEFIFNIPGMGRLMYESILYYDWPVIKMILLLLGCITLLAYFITDLVYKLVDPRVKFDQ